LYIYIRNKQQQLLINIIEMKSTHAKTAQAIRKELKQKYPDTKFSVRSESFAGGNAVRVEWTEGESEEQIKSIVDKYQYGSFNGMIDLYEYTNSRDDIPQVKWISTNRNITPETTAKAIDRINSDYGLNIGYEIKQHSWGDGSNWIDIQSIWLENQNSYSEQFVYREMREMGI
jgi:hypothetical protein